jgi:addiction module HigA family antidote
MFNYAWSGGSAGGRGKLDLVSWTEVSHDMSIKRPAGGWKITRKPVHPGEMLREEFMKPLGISINGLALDLHVPVTRISEIVNERRGITADTALRLARYFGMSADFWMNIQKDYELILAQQKSLRTIEKQVRRRTAA